MVVERVILKEKNFNRLKNFVKQNSDKEIVFTSDDDDLNRKVLEKLPVKILLINQLGRNDFQKQRNSGFNQVMAKIARKNKIQIGINFDEILSSKSLYGKSKILERVRQNISLCNKNKIQMKFISENKLNERDLVSLGLVLGMPTWMTSNLF